MGFWGRGRGKGRGRFGFLPKVLWWLRPYERGFCLAGRGFPRAGCRSVGFSFRNSTQFGRRESSQLVSASWGRLPPSARSSPTPLLSPEGSCPFNDRALAWAVEDQLLAVWSVRA